MNFKIDEWEEVDFEGIDPIRNVVNQYIEEQDKKLFRWLKKGFNYIYTKKPLYDMNFDSFDHKMKVTLEYLPVEFKLDTSIPPFDKYELSYEFQPTRKLLEEKGIDYKNMTYEEFKIAFKGMVE